MNFDDLVIVVKKLKLGKKVKLFNTNSLSEFQSNTTFKNTLYKVSISLSDVRKFKFENANIFPPEQNKLSKTFRYLEIQYTNRLTEIMNL